MKARLPEGYGGQSTNQLMKQMQKMQEDVAALQEELAQTPYTATVGGGMVSLTMLGTHQVSDVKIDPAIINADEAEMLEDLIAAAVNEAVRMVDDDSATRMEAITGGMNIPGMG
ncbi:YbaB/EbfC family nucleoid-associated protein [Ruminococcaceae bacterium OttesenSCG-928-N02]|nr:YbaB/EbfC family nucleoid-associated protein [Ruminococcaceae bacterium OttesenSCG-928-N02]